MTSTDMRDRLRLGSEVSIHFHRTLRIPDDGKVYPLPPGLGGFPIVPVSRHARRVPRRWREQGGFIIPMWQREALWISFDAPYGKPHAVKIGAGGVNAVTGGPMVADFAERTQDYLVIPEQPWIDGFKTSGDVIRQFVAVPLGAGLTAEAQLAGREEEGGLEIMVFEPKPGKFPNERPGYRDSFCVCELSVSSAAMGLGSGGQMRQKLYRDPHGRDTWDAESLRRVHIHIANSALWREITGKEPPPSPIDAATYTQFGFPWFDLYDESKADVPVAAALAGLKSVSQLELGGDWPKEVTVPVQAGQVVGLEG
jgi:hypothetical protein